ncbi:NYN domain-containing protein [Aromatoleum toluclasticum]|uniref:NYN domain-containing protein n=1 Tax=Aromatoleum toluclasticum TaxID=92003 RepID=UPI001D18D230|nr:NYN domain-containing protein [Aromatoleum toluclasticum]MCC4117150.1 NYN domain-containing protein [Aromatoleum toluclasticum]
MASAHDNVSMAVFCDFENVALGVRDAKYEKFDIKPVLERLLLKGSIVVKKAYCDWERYKGFKAVMHEANFELIEIPHVRQSGKNSADIRLVVDALDLCYTKSHVDTFVIISGDSDFSPLVSKLRENAKQVIGVGVKQSTSDLLIANCDEFIFYDDLVRESQRAAKRETREAQPSTKRTPEEEKNRKDEVEARKLKAINIAVETFDALVAERGDSGVRIWASMLKEAIKRRKPDFNESYYGFRAFGNLLEEAQARGLLEFGRDEKSGAYVYRSNRAAAAESVGEAAAEHGAAVEAVPAAGEAAHGEAASATVAERPAGEEPSGRHESRRKRGGRKSAAKKAEAVAEGGRTEAPKAAEAEPAQRQPDLQPQPQRETRASRRVKAAQPAPAATAAEAAGEQAAVPPAEPVKAGARRPRRGKTSTAKAESAQAEPAKSGPANADAAAPVPAAPVPEPAAAPAPVPGAEEAQAKPAARKSAPRSRRPRKTEAPQNG